MNPRRQGSAWRPALFVLFTLAIGVRLLYFAESRGSVFFTVLIGDAKEYDGWAQRIAAGDWLGREVFYQTPLYPYLVATIFSLVGHHLDAVRVAQAAIGAVSCLLLAVAGRRFFDQRSGLIAGLLLAVYPPALFFDGLIQKASLDVLFMTSLLALAGSLQSRIDWKRLAALGLILGLFTLNRENARVLYPVLVVWLFMLDRREPIGKRAGHVAIMTTALVLTVLPVALRNYAVGGEFLVSTSQMGPNFYIGNHKGARGTYEELVPGHGNASYERTDARTLAESALGRTLSASEVSDYWLDRGFVYVRDEPLEWLRLMGRKTLLTLGAVEIVDTESIEVYADHSRVLRALARIHFGVILPLAVFGLWLTRMEWRRLGILYAMGLAIVLAVALFFVVARYRYPIVPIVLLFAGVALRRVPEVARNRPPQAWLGLVLAAVAAVVVNRVPKVAEDDTYTSLGAELIRQDRAAEAIPPLRDAIRDSPGYAVARLDMAIALQRTGDSAGAIDSYKEAIRLRSDYFEAHDGLALTLIELNRAEEAVIHFQRAVALRPDSSEARTNFGSALAQLGKTSEAIAQYEEAIRLNPRSVKAHNNLGVVLHQQGRVDDAIRHFTTALAVDPAYAEAHGNLALAYESKGDANAALAHLREATRLMPGQSQFHLLLGDLLIALGRSPEAIAALERARDLSPASFDARTSLARAYARSGRISDSIEELEEALTLARSNGDAENAAAIERLIRASRARMSAR